MWSEGAWDKIRMSLPDNGNGSRVIVTTQLSDLAVHLSSSPLKLKFLDEDKSWELFCGKTFEKEEDCPVELEEIGKKIVKRCRGLPLSIVVMGGHLRRSRAIEYWEKVAGYMNLISSIGEEEQCLEILILSYQHLLLVYSHAFYIWRFFGKDEWINASKLLQLWIGEGLLRAKKGLNGRGRRGLFKKILSARNLILVEACSWNGKAIYRKVHDSVREVCLNVCEKEEFLCVVRDDTRATSRRERLLVIQKFNSDMIGAKQLSGPPLPLVDCNLLRVLVHDNGVTDGKCLPLAHFQLVNLRSLYFVQYGLHSGESAYSILSSIPACWNL